tara:strand:+ start:2975 stop:5374 length:2400 start_codon:yes stop_codon:yes gene_type:complete
MDKITFSNKVDTKVTSVAEINKVTGANLNEIKNVTNLAIDQVLLKTDKGAYNGTSQDLKDAIDSAVFDGALTYQTVADLPIAPYPAEGTPAKVANDPTNSNNGDWSVSSGAWIQNDNTGVYIEVSRNFIHNEPTLNDAILSVDISEGDAINLAERTVGNGGGAIWDVVLSSSVTENTFNIVQCTGVATLSLVLRSQPYAPTTAQFGVLNGDDVGTAINHALALPAKEITVSKGDYICLTTILAVTNGKINGFGELSKIKIQANSGIDIITANTGFSNFSIKNVSFDGSENYPFDYTVNKNTIIGTNSNIAVFIQQTFDGLEISECFFNKFSHGSIYLQSTNSKNFKCFNNTFTSANYAWKAVGVFTQAPYTDSERMQNAEFYNNSLIDGGVKVHYDASDMNYTSSSDCVQFDAVVGGKVYGNTINNVGGVGIRIEESENISVYGNTIKGTGQEGITCYKDTKNCTVHGNTVRDWGETIPYYSFRSYSGSYYIARETPNSSNAILPTDPSASDWFVEYPYQIDSVDVSTIIAYSATDYLATNPTTGILPFRGFASISYTNGSNSNTITANTVTGSLEQNIGKYVRASDFGFTPCHSVNDPTNPPTGLNNLISDNVIKNTIQFDIYHPRFMDSINENNKLGLSSYGDNILSGTALSKLRVFSNNGGGYERDTFKPTLVPDSGSVTINTSNDELNYIRVGNIVTIMGKIRLSAIFSPTGYLKLGNLPYEIGFYDGESEIPAGVVFGINLTDPLYGNLAIVGEIPGTTDLVLYRTDSGGQVSLSTSLTSTTQFTFNISYLTGE